MAALLVALATATTAHADLPPPDGTRFTGYGLRVDDLEKFPEFVVLAYPASDSNGAPMREYQEAAPGAVLRVGRRGGKPDLYAMRKADYTAWKAASKGTEPELEALFSGDKVIKCDADVSPRHTVPTGTPGDILDVFRVEAIDAKACHVVAAAAPPEPPKPVTTPTSGPPPVKASPAPPPTPPATPAPPPTASGCRSGDGEPLHAAGLVALLLGLRRRRLEAEEDGSGTRLDGKSAAPSFLAAQHFNR